MSVERWTLDVERPASPRAGVPTAQPAFMVPTHVQIWRCSLPMSLGPPASLPAWQSARNTPAGMPAVPTTRRFMAGEQVRTEHETFHEPFECGVRDAGCGTAGSCPRFSSSSSSSSLVLAGSWPVSRSERNTKLSMNFPRFWGLKPTFPPVRNIQRSTFNLQHSTVASVGG